MWKILTTVRRRTATGLDVFLEEIAYFTTSEREDQVLEEKESSSQMIWVKKRYSTEGESQQ